MTLKDQVNSQKGGLLDLKVGGKQKYHYQSVGKQPMQWPLKPLPSCSAAVSAAQPSRAMLWHVQG